MGNSDLVDLVVFLFAETDKAVRVGLCQVQKRTIPNQINLSLSVEFKARGLSKQAGETIGSFGSLSLTNARIPTASGG
jgi:hypothetical protein